MKNPYLKLRQTLQFKNAPPQLLCLIFALSACFILFKVIMKCIEFGITLLETDTLCIDRARVDSLVFKK